MQAHIRFQQDLNAELVARGELVDAQGLAGPDVAKRVTFDGKGAPVVTDGPFPESKELLAGYRMVDVESEERALEIAAQTSAAPGPDGVPIQHPIEVRQVMGAPDTDLGEPTPKSRACCAHSRRRSSVRSCGGPVISRGPRTRCRRRCSRLPGTGRGRGCRTIRGAG
ncbi:hypothetical protein WSS_A10357 [Rhodococcus opacus M213]|uniref:YCII-related domain-containing protein n=1 Tax=Rhodococcus opacus M213 TaxID=1129896 RepID=K8XLW6_RHOOP|nr:hypothetical protein WSS_A10357 [Rhodococcus opacus M213]